MVVLSATAVEPFERLSRYNSPYPAHDQGCAIDLYPPAGEQWARSPVAGTVTDVREVAAPRSADEPPTEYLLVIDTGAWIARLLHVEPSVSPGERVSLGDRIGRYVRSGFFDPWIGRHIHLGFRAHDIDPYRADGSEPIDLDLPVRSVAWNGVGTVIETGDTYARLSIDSPTTATETFVGVAITTEDENELTLDGGVPHYPGGGWADPSGSGPADDQTVSVLSQSVGTVTDRAIAWNDVVVSANGAPITGLSCFLSRSTPSLTLVCPGHEFDPGDTVRVGTHSDR